MDAFWIAAFTNPLLYLGYAFAFVAAIAFLVFLRGFLSGLPHIFTLAGNDEYMPNHRRRAIWGTMMLLALFIVWEIVAWIGHTIGGLFY
jgi:hypothetical protein